MLKSATASREAAGRENTQKPTPDEIREQLASILASPPFHGSKRCHQFLEYVCDHALAGEIGALKERTIAIAVFGRAPQSDLGEDTIVRVGAREVRKRLAQYYVTPEGAAARVRIDLPSGAYSPEFQYQAQAHEPAHEEEAPPALAPELPALARRSWKRPALAAAVCLGLAITVLAAVKLLSATDPNAALFQAFWSPVFQSSEPLVLAVANPIVYHPSRRIIGWSEAHQPPQDEPVQRPVLPPAKMEGSDLVPVFNQYVGFGDMVAANEVSSMLARKSKAVHLRMASGIEFADLRKAPIFLIGAVTNRWTMELQQSWRFRFARRTVDVVISDTQEGHDWSIPAKDDGSSPEDYFLICRIRHSFTGGLTVVAAGLKQFGTEAAGRLVADPEQLGVILHKLPAGWDAKNLQIVLHARVIGNTPAQPDVVAVHVW
jgi:hypothetical protein